MELGLWMSFGIIFFLLGLSGFFSGSETAMTAVSNPRMAALEKEGNKRAALVNRIYERKEKMIGALLLGNNLVNILASALATSALINVFGDAGVVYATLVMTLLVLIFAEVLPKTYAFHFADRMALTIAPIMRVLIFILSPIVECITAIVRLVLKIMGIDISVVSVGGDVEELRGAIELHRGPDKDTNEQRAMLKSILDLSTVDVEEIMTHRKNVEMFDIEQPVGKLVEALLDCAYSRIPLYRGDSDNIVGVMSIKSLTKELHVHNGDISKINIENIMNECWFVPETTILSEQLQAFRERREHFALVVDEYGSYMGVVTLEDLLEEIVGEIEDETDEIVSGVRRQPNGSFIVKGDVPVRDLNREFEWDLPQDEDYSTIAGLILHEAKIIPEAGQSFSFYGLRLDVVRRHRQQITLIRITPSAEKAAEEEAA
jgi:Mg2+/Co2+ transporter CorB